MSQHMVRYAVRPSQCPVPPAVLCVLTFNSLWTSYYHAPSESRLPLLPVGSQEWQVWTGQVVQGDDVSFSKLHSTVYVLNSVKSCVLLARNCQLYCSDWYDGGMWRLVLSEVLEVQLFGCEGQWIGRDVVWMSPPAPDSVGGDNPPSADSLFLFIVTRGLLWSSKAVPSWHSAPSPALILSHRGGNSPEQLAITITFIHFFLHLGFLSASLLMPRRPHF